MANLSDIINDLEALSSSDKEALVGMLEERWGVKSSFVPSAPGPDVPATQRVEKTEFEVVLTGFKDKISCIKEVRQITGLDLKSAKDFVEAAPKQIAADISREQADQLVARLVANGGIAEVR